jgi:class 3 adenylate cyclase
MELTKAVIVLADIGGYTRFIKMHATSLVHAERIITDLLESVIGQAEYPLTLNKLEGDAALFFAGAGQNTQAVLRSAFQQAEGFFQAFHQKRDELEKVRACPCDACTGVGQLRIKAILHYGEVLLKQVRQFQELAGVPVIVAHRLLKNSVQKDEYILVSQAFEQAAGGLRPAGGVRLVEECEGIGQVPVVAFDPPPPGTAAPYRTTWMKRTIRRSQLFTYQGFRALGWFRGREFKSLAGV